jgi:hypothetical protein
MGGPGSGRKKGSKTNNKKNWSIAKSNAVNRLEKQIKLLGRTEGMGTNKYQNAVKLLKEMKAKKE